MTTGDQDVFSERRQRQKKERKKNFKDEWMNEWGFLYTENRVLRELKMHEINFGAVVEWLEQLGYGAESRRIA